jgi:hypothetical protein
MPPVTLRRIISTWWFRFRRALEDTPTVLLVMSPVICTRSCAAMTLHLHNDETTWPATAASLAPTEKPAVDERSPKHLSLVNSGSDTCRATMTSHAHFLSASTIRVQRERPVEWMKHPIQFTSG